MASAPDRTPLISDPESAENSGTYPRQRRPQDAAPNSSGLVSANKYTDNRRKNYKGQLSINLGQTEIFLQTLAIALNGVGVGLQNSRQHWIANVVFITFPSVWTGIFVYLAAAFAIAAGKYKYRGLIITHLIMAIIGSVFAFVFFGFACAAVAFEMEDVSRDKGSAIVGGIWVVLSLVLFVILIWGSVLCCQVLSCGDPNDAVDVTMLPVRSSGQSPGGSHQ